MINKAKIKKFQEVIWQHYHVHKRNFPWRETTNPYRILVSEIMLQQTQANRVVEKYQSFIKKIPNFKSLANIETKQLLLEWQGLGYNRRALQLQRLAQIVAREHRGRLPHDNALLQQLPGIGPATAAAIRAFTFNLPTVYLDTNVRRVYLHYFFPEQAKIYDKELFPLIEKSFDTSNSREWCWALLDYGAMLGKDKKNNPNQRSAHFTKQTKFEGSNRQLRGQLLKNIITHNGISQLKLLSFFAPTIHKQIQNTVEQLITEGFIFCNNKRYYIKPNTK
ncbi:MAG: A/G-specific adenine glycosylase [Candidatus Falkowbacteria bacterium]